MATIETKEGADVNVALMIGFSMGFFFHPKYLAERMEGYARTAAY